MKWHELRGSLQAYSYRMRSSYHKLSLSPKIRLVRNHESTLIAIAVLVYVISCGLSELPFARNTFYISDIGKSVPQYVWSLSGPWSCPCGEKIFHRRSKCTRSASVYQYVGLPPGGATLVRSEKTSLLGFRLLYDRKDSLLAKEALISRLMSRNKVWG